MTHLDLFSGIGGFSLAARWAGIETIGFCEIDPYASAVLKKHWPSMPNFGDVKNLTHPSSQKLISLCHALSQINIRIQQSDTTRECQLETSQDSTASLDRQCTIFYAVEDAISVLNSDMAREIISLEAQGQITVPGTFLNTLYETALSAARPYAKNAERRHILKTAETQFKLTIPTIASLSKFYGSASDAITNGTNTIQRKEQCEPAAVRIDVLTGGFP